MSSHIRRYAFDAKLRWNNASPQERQWWGKRAYVCPRAMPDDWDILSWHAQRALELVMPQRVRFWDWWLDDWVKISVEPFKDVELNCGGPTDEGWAYEARRFEWDIFDGVIKCHMASEGRDCDGRHSSGATFIWTPGGQLGEADDGTKRPEWISERNWQRDHAAEAAGY